jgi:energy-coupling factor transporter ATP-binding protein EcfA2
MNETANQLRGIIQNAAIKKTVLPAGETLNTIYRQYGSDGVEQVLYNVDPVVNELEEVEAVETLNIALPVLPNEEGADPETPQEPEGEDQPDPGQPRIEVIHENKLLMCTTINHYSVLGALSQDLSGLRITLMVEELSTGRKERTKLDLYERDARCMFALQLAEQFHQSPEQLEADLLMLTDLLEKHREQQLEAAKPSYQSKRQYAAISPDQQKQAVAFLSAPDVIGRMDKLIEKAGVVGEENTRKLLFMIASTFKMSHPLHALVQGSSGSGKSHLINTIGQCFPPEEVMSMTRVTSKSFYHYTKDELVDKLILIQDYDGLDEEAQYAFRELQSAGNISSSTTYKDRFGNLLSAIKTVRSHFASLLATTKAEIYCDNMSRSVIVGIDESEEQTQRIIEYQNKKLASLIDEREERKAKDFLQNCMRCIRPYEVVNRYADKIRLPIEAKMLRRLNSHYQAFVKQVTILHQYQRKKDAQGRLIAEPEDLQMACDILFDAIMLKVDDLDSSLRQFFDRMKEFISEQAKGKQQEYQFTQRDVRLALSISKTQCFRYMEDLELLEYVQRTGGYANRGFKYKIVFWDDMEKIRTKVKSELAAQLATLNIAA